MVKDKSKEIQNINFQIKVVDLVKSFLAAPVKQFTTVPNFNFTINLEQKLDHTNKCLIVITNVEITTTDDLDTILGSASVACVFSIENYDEVVTIDKNKHAHIKDVTSNVLNSISISTTRGVLSQIFRGTILHHAILPVLDPKSFKSAHISE
jgi:hypothetical protein